jgi:glycosyltransferase involved in cell wall biosynthesis
LFSTLIFRWRRFAARLHRLRVAWHSRGWRTVVRRVRGATPSANGASRAVADNRSDPIASASSDRRILIIDVTTPRPDRDSGSLRLMNLMTLLRERGFEIDFLPDDRAEAGRYTQALHDLGIRVHRGPGTKDYPEWLRRHGAAFDTVVVCRYHLGEFLIPLIRVVCARARVVLDTVDLHHLREEREALMRKDARLSQLAGETRRRELAVAAKADVVWVVSSVERTLLSRAIPGLHCIVLPNIHNLSRDIPSFSSREGLLFIGGARHPPNVDAVRWLLRDIFPTVRERLPGRVLHIVGEGMGEALGDDASTESVIVHGYVPDLGPLLSGSRVGLAPLRFGAGVKGKVNVCMAAGMPVIATACAAEGMHLRDGEDALIANSDAAFAEAIVRLYMDAELWHRLSLAGLRNVQQHFSTDTARAALDATFSPP